jgi:hypothetical protein
MFTRKKSNKHSKVKKTAVDLLFKCRCGGKASKPKEVAGCKDRWIIRCQIEQCYAYNIGQGLADTIQGWNRLSTHLYR